jgi:hypothetical protein
MINPSEDKYKYWIKNPIEIDPNEDINKNIFNSPGYIIRDYRFYPKLLPADIRKYISINGFKRVPSKLQLFYAWELSNEQQALKNNRRYIKYRKKSTNKIELKRFDKMYSKKRKIYFLYNDIVRKDCINIIDEILHSKEDADEYDMFRFYIIFTHINLNIDDYNEYIYKDFIRIILHLMWYVTAIKFNNYNDQLINIIVELKGYHANVKEIPIMFDKLITINKIINSLSL